MSIKRICQRDVITVTEKTSISEAAKLMRRYHVGDLIVVQSQNGAYRPLGMLTDRDIVTLIVAEEVNPHFLKVEDIMARHMVTVSENEDTYSTIELMQQAGVRRLPVVSEYGDLVGIIAMDDVLAYLTEELAGLSAITEEEVYRESTGTSLKSRF